MIAEVSAALTGLKTAMDMVKSIKDSNASLQEAEMKLQFIDLIEKLVETKMNMAEIQTLLMEKDESIKDLEEKLKIKGDIKYDGTLYWLLKDNCEKEGPFCQKCFDTTDRLIRMQYDNIETCQEYGDQIMFVEQWHCLSCGNKYYPK